MAGGIGSRFWPLSKANTPKQFLDILGTGKSLIRQTFERFKHICSVENFLVVTNHEYKSLVLEQLPELTEAQILLEPFGRNTAPCIAYANQKIVAQNSNARVVVTPADHMITNEVEFCKVVKSGLEFIAKNSNLLTLGIKPTRAETGYGYIQIQDSNLCVSGKICKAKTFTEKPNIDMAEMFIESGDFLWNSGIFIWSIDTIMSAFKKYQPDLHTLFTGIASEINTPKETEAINDVYSQCDNLSIDNAVLEKADNVCVYCSDFGWSDLGTWGSLYDHLPKDINNNATDKKEKVLFYESKNCIVKNNSDKLIAIQGLKDYIVVETDDTLLICRRKDEQEIRRIANDVKVAQNSNK